MSRFIAPVIVALGVGTAWLIALPPAPVAQPIAFNHAAHKPIACATCHRGARVAARADIPQGELCLKCHTTAPRAAGADTIWARLPKDTAIEWITVTRLPDDVMFSHRRHVALAGLECASCHGEVTTRTVPIGTPPLRLDMDACLSCHRREGASEDCAGCHR